MAQDIKIKRSSVPGKVPTVETLQLGELAANTYDGKLFVRKDNGEQSIIDLTTPLWTDIQNKPDPTITVSLSGDVSGSNYVTLTDLQSGSINIATSINPDLLNPSFTYYYSVDVPTDPTIGNIWYNWNNGFHYIYTIDSNLNEYWLQLGSSGGSGSINYLTESDVITVSNTSISTYNFNYNTNYIQVFINRLKLRKSEFVANTGTDITINIELVEGDEIEFVTSDLYPIPQ